MKKIVLSTIVILVALSTILTTPRQVGAQVIYEEYFTDGNLHLNWFDGWEYGDNMSAISYPGNPGGDGWVGKLATEMSMVATSLAGAPDLEDYSIEADIYTKVTAGMGPWHGVVARWDTTNMSYYLLMCDFDSSQRIRLSYNLGASPSTIHQWVGDEIPGGVPESTGWHKLKLKVVSDSIWAYFDDILLPGCPFNDTGTEVGFFGVYVFCMSGIDSTLCDNIIVSQEGVGIEEEPYAELPKVYLSQNYPNPFNQGTEIKYYLPRDVWVKLEIYNVLGQKVTTLVNQYQNVGPYSIQWRPEVANGIYFYRLQTSLPGQKEFTTTKKMILLR